MIAIPKLIKVPIKIYSVNFRCLDSFKSPNLNTDLAVIKKPTASQWSAIMKIKTNSRSKIPMYFPASFSDSFPSVNFEMFHFEKMVFMIIDTGRVKNNMQNKSKRLF